MCCTGAVPAHRHPPPPPAASGYSIPATPAEGQILSCDLSGMDVEKEAENAEEGADEDVARMKPTERVTYIKCKRKGVPPLPTKHLTEYLDFVISATGSAQLHVACLCVPSLAGRWRGCRPQRAPGDETRTFMMPKMLHPTGETFSYDWDPRRCIGNVFQWQIVAGSSMLGLVVVQLIFYTYLACLRVQLNP